MLRASDILMNYEGERPEPHPGLVLARAAGVSEKELEGYLQLGATLAAKVYPMVGMQAEYYEAMHCPDCNFRNHGTSEFLRHLQSRHGWTLRQIGAHLRKLGH